MKCVALNLGMRTLTELHIKNNNYYHIWSNVHSWNKKEQMLQQNKDARAMRHIMLQSSADITNNFWF